MVLMGGPSAERSVSLASGEAVAAALESRGHRVTRADVSPEDLSAFEQADVDLVFVALHGSFGEDGRLQHILEQRGLRYTGSGSQASRLGMDKIEAKRRFAQAGVPTPPFVVAEACRRDHVALEFPFPVIVKPADQGSSVDCSIVRQASDLASAVSHVVDRYGRCLIEPYICGPELTVGILAGQALPVCQIRSATAFYDYEAKYQDDRTEYLFDIDLPGELLQRVQRLSVTTFETLGCRDMSRVDWMIDAATCQPYCLEVNTIPGFTSHSVLPKAAARAGISFADLCEQIVRLAMQR
ncbi:MAG TPA: D-alanine--D-alanine ligase [Phycisphaerae bacterium]|nr:D-alanine--D-alanine ligase [Phycisphaerae bacterium]